MAEIEAALRRDDPGFVRLIEHLEFEPPGPSWPMSPLPSVVPPLRPVELPSAWVPPSPPEPEPEPAEVAAPRRGPRRVRRVVGVAVAFVVALVLTGVVTVVFGPESGGLVGVLTSMAATIYSYQCLHGCRGFRP